MANRGRYCRRAGSEIDWCWHLTPSITCVKFRWNLSNVFEVINQNKFQNGRHKIKMAARGRCCGLVFSKMSCSRYSLRRSFVWSFIEVRQTVLKISTKKSKSKIQMSTRGRCLGRVGSATSRCMCLLPSIVNAKFQWISLRSFENEQEKVKM